MRKNLPVFLIMLLVVFGFGILGYFKSVSAPASLSGPQPKIEITPKEYNFGDVAYGQVLTYNFKVKNLGEVPLEINRVGTSCGCTTAKVSLNKIEPGQEADLAVVYDTGAMSGPHGKGNQERIIYVKNSDPLNPQATVVINANVK